MSDSLVVLRRAIVKPVVLLLSFLFMQVAVCAQQSATATSSPDLQVVKFNWSKERYNWEQNPYGGPNENFHEMQFRARSEKRVSDAKRSNSPEANKLEKEARADTAIIEAERQRKGPPRYTFLYKAWVKNTS